MGEIDIGEYNITYDDTTKIFLMDEQITGEHREFLNLDQMIDFIRADIINVLKK